MIQRLFKSRAPAPLAAPRVPAGTRLYAIGDIHGRVELLRSLRHVIQADAAQHTATRNLLICLGDYVDRGGDSRAVIDMILDETMPGFECIYLKGNHEDTLLAFLEDETIGPGWLMQGGGAATLYSYGVRPPQSPADTAALRRTQSDLAERLPAAHLGFLRNLPLFHVEGDYIFVHAGLRPDVPFDRQTSDDMLWIRDEFLRSDTSFGKIVVHGHSITDAPDIRPNRIGIDTGAFASGRLTCLVLDGTERSFLQT